MVLAHVKHTTWDNIHNYNKNTESLRKSTGENGVIPMQAVAKHDTGILSSCGLSQTLSPALGTFKPLFDFDQEST